MDREQAARIGGMDRETRRSWVHRFNEDGPDGLRDTRSKCHLPRLSKDQLSKRALEDHGQTELIRAAWSESGKVYCYRKLRDDLAASKEFDRQHKAKAEGV